MVCHTYKHMREIGFVCDTKIFEKFSLACEIDNVWGIEGCIMYTIYAG